MGENDYPTLATLLGNYLDSSSELTPAAIRAATRNFCRETGEAGTTALVGELEALSTSNVPEEALVVDLDEMGAEIDPRPWNGAYGFVQVVLEEAQSLQNSGVGLD